MMESNLHARPGRDIGRAGGSRPRCRPAVEQLEDRTTPSFLGTPTPVVSLEKFVVVNGQPLAGLLFTLPGDAQQLVITPAVITSVQRAPHSRPIVDLSLGPVHLDYHGLVVDLQPFTLRVQAVPGPGQVLGNLLSNPTLKGPALLNTLVGELNTLLQAGDLLSNVTAPAGPLGSNTPLNVQQLANDLAGTGITAGTSACTVLTLNTGAIDLNLLGLDVSVPTGIHLTITAVPSSQPGGGLVGDLVCALSHALDTPSLVAGKLTSADLTNILTSLVNPLQRGLPTLGTLSLGGVSRRALTSANTASTGTGSHASGNVVSLTAGSIDLNVLGLRTTSSPINLKITARRGPGNAMGNLLSESGVSLARALQTVNTFLNSLTMLENGQGGLATGPLSNAALIQGAIGALAANLASTASPPSSCQVLSLTLGPLNVNLLGLAVTLDSATGGLGATNLTAIPGPGNLLSDLLCDLAGLVNSIR